MTQQEYSAFWHLTTAGFQLNDDATWTGPFTGLEVTDTDRTASQLLVDQCSFGHILPIAA